MIHNDKRKKPPRSPSVEDWILKCSVYTPGASQVALVVKKVPASAGDIRDAGSVPGFWKIPRRRAWQPTPVSLPGEPRGQRSLRGCSPWGHRESDTTEATAHTRTHVYRHYSALKRKPVLTHATV